MLRASSEIGAASHTACGIYMRDDKFSTTNGIVNLHTSMGTHWVLYINKFYSDSCGCPPPLNEFH